MALTVTKQFLGETGELEEYLALVVVDAKTYQPVHESLVHMLVKEQRTPGVYVCLNKPGKVLEQKFSARGVDTRLIIFIDCFTRLADDQIKRENNILYIGSPERLSDLSVSIEQAVNAIPTKQRFVVFDSLSTLLIYNKGGTVARFFHFLSTKMRSLHVKGIVLSMETKQEADLLNDLSQFCDNRFDFRGG